MVEMPVPSENPTIEEAVRALELAYSYYAITGLCRNPTMLARYTNRAEIGHACNPIVGTPKEQVQNLCRHAVGHLATPAAKHGDTVWVGATRLRGTMRAYCGMPPIKPRKPASERKARPKHYQVAFQFEDGETFTLGHCFKRKDEALRKARTFPEVSSRKITGARVRAFYKKGGPLDTVVFGSGSLK